MARRDGAVSVGLAGVVSVAFLLSGCSASHQLRAFAPAPVSAKELDLRVEDLVTRRPGLITGGVQVDPARAVVEVDQIGDMSESELRSEIARELRVPGTQVEVVAGLVGGDTGSS